MAERLRQRVAELGVADRVIFTGAVPSADLPAIYSAANVFVFPSTTARECMGLSMKQAMACGVPVVAARAGGATEAVEDGATGLCCAPNDADDLARAAAQILLSPEQSAMGKAGYERAKRYFDQERTFHE